MEKTTEETDADESAAMNYALIMGNIRFHYDDGMFLTTSLPVMVSLCGHRDRQRRADG